MQPISMLMLALAMRGPEPESAPPPSAHAAAADDAPGPDDAGTEDPVSEDTAPLPDEEPDAIDDADAPDDWAESPDPHARSRDARPPAKQSPPRDGDASTPVAAQAGSSGLSPAAARRRAHTYEDIPIRWRLDLGASGGTTFVPDRAFFAFTPVRRHLAGFTIDARVDFPIANERVFVGGGVSYRRAGRKDGIYDGRLATTLRVQDPLALGRFSFRLFDGLDAYGQVAGGPSIVDITTSSSDVSRTAYQRRVMGAFEAVGGVALYLPKKLLPHRGSSHITGGIDAALGYSFRGRMNVAPILDTEDDAIATSSVELGDMALRGLVWRVGLFIRFM